MSPLLPFILNIDFDLIHCLVHAISAIFILDNRFLRWIIRESYVGVFGVRIKSLEQVVEFSGLELGDPIADNSISTTEYRVE